MILGCIDPRALLVIPEDNQLVLEDQLKRFLEYRDFAELAWLKLFVSAHGIEALAKISGYPLWGPIEHQLRAAGSVFDVRDVIVIFNALLKLPVIEDDLGLVDFLANTLSVVPDTYKVGNLALAAAFEYIGTLMCLAKIHFQLDDKQLAIFTANLVGLPKAFHFEAQIELYEYSEPRISDFEKNKNLSGQVMGLQTSDDLYRWLDPYLIWQRAERSEHLELAIKAYLLTEKNIPFESRPNWKVGSELITSIRSKHLNGPTMAAQILRSISEVILADNMRDTHHLQKSRNTDIAWRRDVNRDAHLHYWTTSNGPEIAWVTVTHDDYYIPT